MFGIPPLFVLCTEPPKSRVLRVFPSLLYDWYVVLVVSVLGTQKCGDDQVLIERRI